LFDYKIKKNEFLKNAAKVAKKSYTPKKVKQKRPSAITDGHFCLPFVAILTR
jgi:hypothetical protein